MTAYYNEIDPYCAQWLRNLIAAGEIPPGDVDERPIEEVSADDVKGYTQCHWFAGIGGWAYAARLAGWPDDRPIWTGSCPCQPFSRAGRHENDKSDKHLWPDWNRLIAARRPLAVAGEQVATATGRGWIDAVFDDLERENYACGAATAPACSVGAPELRERLWFCARPVEYAGSGRYGDADQTLCPRRTSSITTGCGTHWSSGKWETGLDEKARWIKSGIHLLVDGFPGRVDQVRAYGNSIVPQVAAQVLMAWMEAEE